MTLFFTIVAVAARTFFIPHVPGVTKIFVQARTAHNQDMMNKKTLLGKNDMIVIALLK